jgi:shikimate kinase
VTEPRVVVLVGLSGSGKSATGAILARRTGRRFVDLDSAIEAEAGARLEEIFREEGEPGFRRREAEVTSSLPVDEPVVIAAGGGWMARPGVRDTWPDAVRVWLRVSPEEAARRLAGSAPRPLLANESPVAGLQSLLDARLPSYRLAEYTVDTDGRSPAQVADAVAVALDLDPVGAAAPDPGQNDSP